MRSYVTPRRQVVLRLQNGLYRLVEVKPNTVISIPKYGSFSANLLLGRPLYVTYELEDKQDGDKKITTLRVVPPAELHAETLGNDANTPAESRDERTTDTPDESIDIVADDGQVLVRNNRLTVDDPSRQALTHEEIEELKRADAGSGKDIIAKIMAAHSALGEKTQFSLAKYTLRKTKKYMRRFTVLPVDVGTILKLWMEKDPPRVMELREEMLGLMMSWGNVHHSGDVVDGESRGRYLIVDDTSGLLTAAVAERMGILYPEDDEDDLEHNPVVANGAASSGDTEMRDAPTAEQDQTVSSEVQTETSTTATETQTAQSKPAPGPWPSKRPYQSSAKSNTITVLHANTQPNVSLLEPFGYDADKPNAHHPLHTHLRTLTWLQLLDPDSDSLYQEPPPPEPENTEDAALPLHQRIANLKSGKRSAYWKKKRRWERVRSIVDETRAGGFDSLLIASTMDPLSMLPHLVPLLRGGGNIAIYSPTVESLTKIMDLYSRDRRAAYIKYLQEAQEHGIDEPEKQVDKADFPVDPTLVLNPMLQTARAREWQVLPMRTHPVMTARGGAEGYLFTGTRVLPVKGQRVEAKGKFGKKRKVEGSEEKAGSKKSSLEVIGDADSMEITREEAQERNTGGDSGEIAS